MFSGKGMRVRRRCVVSFGRHLTKLGRRLTELGHLLFFLLLLLFSHLNTYYMIMTMTMTMTMTMIEGRKMISRTGD